MDSIEKAKLEEEGYVFCKKCKHKWIPRIENIRKCPECQTIFWRRSPKPKGIISD